MLRFVLRRVLLVLPVLFGLLVLTFVLVRIVPNDPSAALAGQNATPQQIAEIRARYGFDRPLIVQFGIYLRQVAQADLGVSTQSGRPVARDILQRLPATIELTFAALLLGAGLGIPLGVLAAVRHNTWVDHGLRFFTVGGVAIASFWFAIMLQLLFSMQLDLLPLRGRLSTVMVPPANLTGFLLLDSLLTGRLDAFRDAIIHLALPAVTLSLGAMATITRFTRSGVLETMQKDYVLYEIAAGYPRGLLIAVYVLRNSVVATVTQIGLLFGALLAGAVIVESIFDWPGIGSYAVSAILTSDYKAILAVTLLVGVVYSIVNILVDLIHGLIDPRVAAEL
ncbi:MAG TPA: ABC transporter permease [Candidatus Methylomirabilis sp.]|nr:ABC transporter permease [Candidatus Methylomirabilis sp.]